jgi:sulfatase maturation enzyme AslB (radical SAM superfamily)
MDWETIRESVDLALRSPHESVDLVFLGGEPLLEFAALRRAVEHAEQRLPAGKRVGYKISTNGVLLCEEVADFLAEHRVYTQLSFDGVREAQDVRCEGTFAALDRLLDSLRERHPRFLHSCLIASITVVPATVGYLADSIDYFLSKGVARIGVAPSITSHGDWCRDDIGELEAQFSRILRSSLRHLEQTGDVPLTLLRWSGEGPGPSGDSFPSMEEGDSRSIAQMVRPPGGAEHQWSGRSMCHIAESETPTVDVDGQVYGCGLYARSVSDLHSPLHLACLPTMQLGDVRDPGLAERYERFREAVNRLPVYAEKERKYSAYRRCVDCPHFDVCRICPFSLGHVEGNADPHRVPDFACAFGMVTFRHRDRFPRQQGVRALVLGEQYREEMARWANIARAAREARS